MRKKRGISAFTQPADPPPTVEECWDKLLKNLNGSKECTVPHVLMMRIRTVKDHSALLSADAKLVNALVIRAIMPYDRDYFKKVVSEQRRLRHFQKRLQAEVSMLGSEPHGALAIALRRANAEKVIIQLVDNGSRRSASRPVNCPRTVAEEIVPDASTASSASL